MRCRFCHHPMAYIHGHAACVTQGCPLHGVNQAECCDGETVMNCPVPTSDLARGPETERESSSSD
ncbi:MAG: hypothetical protein R3B40_24075 [Polyangiales bacterium]